MFSGFIDETTAAFVAAHRHGDVCVPRLYDLSADLHGDHDIAASHPDIVRWMTEIIYREHRAPPDYPITLPKQD